MRGEEVKSGHGLQPDLILPTPPSVGHSVTCVLKYLSLSANIYFEGAPVAIKHCLIQLFKREKYLEQSLNAIKSLCRGNCLIFQLSSAQLNSAAGAVSSSQKCCNSRGSPREADLHRRKCKGFSCKTNMFFLMSTRGFRVKMDVKGHLTDQHTGSAQGWRRSARRSLPPLSQLRKHLAN